MEIRSEFIENGECLLQEQLSDYSSSSLINKEICRQNKKEVKLSCQLKLSSELCIINNRLDVTRSITQTLAVEGDLIQLSCLLEGSTNIHYNQKDLKQEAGKVSICTRCSDQQLIKMPAAHTHYIIILISCSYFLKLLRHENWIKEDLFYKDIEAGKDVELGAFDLPLEFPLYQVLEDIICCDWEASKQLSYTEIKLKELFLQVHHQQQLSAKTAKNYSQDCIRKIRQASAYLTLNYHSPPTINALSRIVLLNEVQLKSGFKDMYGSTIRNYITELRMKRAPGLLVTCTVNETAGLLGYKSVSHFISNFKKFHGKTPKQFLSKSLD